MYVFFAFAGTELFIQVVQNSLKKQVFKVDRNRKCFTELYGINLKQNCIR